MISAKLTSLTFSPPPRLLRTESRLSRCRCFLASVEFHSIVADSKLDWTGARLSLDPDRLRSKTNSLPLSVNLELYHNHLVIVKRSRRRRVDLRNHSGVFQLVMILPTSNSPIRSSLELSDGLTATGKNLREEERRDFESITSSSRHLFREVDELIEAMNVLILLVIAPR